MILSDGGYEKSDLLKVTEEIYSIKGRIQDLQLALDDEKFHYKYISTRKNTATTQSLSRIMVIILLTFVSFLCLVIFIFGCIVKAPMFGLAMGFAGGLMIACGYVDVKLISEQIRVSRMLHHNFSNEKALRFASKKDMLTYQSDAIKSKEKIALLEEDIRVLSDKLAACMKKQAKLLEQKEKNEEFLKNIGVIVENSVPESSMDDGRSSSGLSLKNRDDVGDNIQEMYEFYSQEENYMNRNLSHLNFELDQLNKRITAIEDKFEIVKQKLVVALVCFVVLIIIQGTFSGNGAALTAIICSFISLAIIFYLDKTCTGDVFLYLIEHDSKITSEYAFRNNIIPLYRKRSELLKIIETNKEELAEVKAKKDALDM